MSKTLAPVTIVLAVVSMILRIPSARTLAVRLVRTAMEFSISMASSRIATVRRDTEPTLLVKLRVNLGWLADDMNVMTMRLVSIT